MAELIIDAIPAFVLRADAAADASRHDGAAPDLDADDRAALLGAAGAARLPALDDPHPAGGQPHLPVLDPHRAGEEAARLVRVLLRYALAPPRPPQLQRGLSRPQLRRHTDHLGPPLRQLPGRDRA